jgi:hypothetical protein
MAQIGQLLTFAVAFTNTSGVATDPTTVRFMLHEGIDGTELEWLYNAAPTEGTHYPVGANPIVRDSAGSYHVAWVSRKPERHVGFWKGAGNSVNQTSQSAAFVRHSDVAIMDASVSS